jgi:hypothetical protein
MVRRMVSRVWVGAAAALGALLAGCGGKSGGDAASAAQAFLASVQADDRAAFEGYIDRAAVRRDMRAQIVDLGRAAGVEVDGGPSEFALNRMIAPSNIKLVQAGASQSLSAAPTLAQVEPLLRKLDGTHVCLHDLTPKQACVLTFEKQKAGKDETGGQRKAGWRLVKMPATALTFEVGAEPKKG